MPPRFFRVCLLFVSLALWQPGPAQEIPEAFRRLADSVIDQCPKTYQDLDAALRPFRRDTVLMGYFSRRCQEEGFLDGLAYSYNQTGILYRNTSDYSRAIELHERALDAAKQANNLEFRIFSLNMLGVVYRRLDAIKTALDYSQEALSLADNVAEPSEGIRRSRNVSLNSIGNIYQALEQYGQAIEHFQRSFELEEELDNKYGMAVNLQNIGECLEAQGKMDEALERFRLAVTYDREIGSDRGVAICQNSIGRIYIKQNRFGEALELLEQALEEALKTRDQHIIVPIYNNLGWAHLKSKNYKEAEAFLQKAIEKGHELGLVRDVSQGYSLLSDLSADQGDYQKALEFYRQSEEFQHQITNEVNNKYVNDIILRYGSEKQKNQLAILAQENEIINLKLRRNRTTLLIGALLLVLFTLILYIIYRQYQLTSEKKVMTLEQTMLRSQMNPHFLFNSLNSIKHYIINNEQKNAVHYLNKFSKLVRKILETSSMKEISLEEELETITLYMNIENIRFNEEIDFGVEIDPRVNPASVKIPSLILQPFLENALWHGLSSKEGNKRIRITVSQDHPGLIRIAIRDNGIGREAAEKLKESKVLKRKSVGISITRERLANFSRIFQNSFDLSIRDLYAADGTVEGTEVVLTIPTI
jgi:tetratricopeptide (TPR) repeat protein